MTIAIKVHHKSVFAAVNAGSGVNHRDNLSLQCSRKFDDVPPTQRLVNFACGKTDVNVCQFFFNTGHWENECPVLTGKLMSLGKKVNSVVPTIF